MRDAMKDNLYVVSRGCDGPMIAGPYLGYEVAVRARDAMPGWRWRPMRRWFRLEARFWVRPAESRDYLDWL